MFFRNNTIIGPKCDSWTEIAVAGGGREITSPAKLFDPSYSGEQLRQPTLLFVAICSDAGAKERNREREK
jgi:hypothetical protein